MVAVLVFLSAFMVSVIAIRLMTPIAIKIGLVDKPGGHKLHEDHVPLVGGIAIYLSVFLAWILMPLLGIATINSIFVAAGGLLFAVGLIDDRIDLSVKLRLAMQIAAALMLVYSQVVLKDFGFILSDELVTLGILAIPLTVFATVGVINAMNMIDGIDGLAGLVSFTSLTLLLVVAYVSASKIQMLLIVCVMGAVTGFLLFNMRWKGGDKAHIFLGDAGSTILGFLFAYLFISLSQGEQRAMSPVTGLWLFAIPLMDTVGVMIRRIWLKKSPFSADRGHLHHLLLDSGFLIHHAVLFIASLQLVLGVIGLAWYYLGIPDSVSFIAFLAVFSGYGYLISRPWRIVPRLRTLHRKADLTVKGVQHIYVGELNSDTAVADIETMLGDRKHDHQFEIFEGRERVSGKKFTFAVIDARRSDEVKRLVSNMKNIHFSKKDQKPTGNKKRNIRQYIVRNQNNDRRRAQHVSKDIDRRKNDRRSNDARLIRCSKECELDGRELVEKIA